MASQAALHGSFYLHCIYFFSFLWCQASCTTLLALYYIASKCTVIDQTVLHWITALYQDLSKYPTGQETFGTPNLTKHNRTLARLGYLLSPFVHSHHKQYKTGQSGSSEATQRALRNNDQDSTNCTDKWGTAVQTAAVHSQLYSMTSAKDCTNCWDKWGIAVQTAATYSRVYLRASAKPCLRPIVIFQ